MSGDRRSPFLWVPSAYFAMGLSYVALTNLTAIMFKNIGMDNGKAAEYASYFILAYTIKPLFSWVVEIYRTKKFFVMCMQVAIGVGFGVAALALSLPNSLWLLLTLFWVISFLGSTQDIATDGVYITALQPRQQSAYCGVQSLAWNSAPIVASGGLVYLSGWLHSRHFGHDPAATGAVWIDSWQLIFALVAAVYLLFPLWHWKAMPDGARAQNTPRSAGDAARVMRDAFTSFFAKRDVWKMISFTFFFNFSIGFLEKVGPFFVVDPLAKGGLGQSNEMLGLLYGTYGLGGVLLGALVGGLYVSRFGCNRTTVLQMCFAVNVPNITFLLMAIYQPSNLAVIATGIVVEKFFMGFGVIGFVVYLMQQVAPGPYTTAHYAFATGLKGLCGLLTGVISGHLQVALGYVDFFIFVMIATLPSFIATWFAPFHRPADGTPTDADDDATGPATLPAEPAR